VNSSIVIIAMPDIFRGVSLDPLDPGNSAYLLWMILGYLITSSVLVVSVGRLGDMLGRVRMFNLGFVVYTAATIALSADWMTGRAGIWWLLAWRVIQGTAGGSAFPRPGPRHRTSNPAAGAQQPSLPLLPH
jgi:MFS family permease